MECKRLLTFGEEITEKVASKGKEIMLGDISALRSGLDEWEGDDGLGDSEIESWSEGDLM